jgi:hypothetical protein
MMSLQLYQNASQGPRKPELVKGDLDAEIDEVRCGRRSQNGENSTGDFHKRNRPHQATSARPCGKFHAMLAADLSGRKLLLFATFCQR